MARPAAAVSVPAATKLVVRIATAVELCSASAATSPVMAATIRLSSPCRSQRLSGTDQPRSTPVRTRRTDQISSAAAPATCSRKRRGDDVSTDVALIGPRPSRGCYKFVMSPSQNAAGHNGNLDGLGWREERSS